MEDGHCVSISFHDENEVFGGTIRKHPSKREIVDAVAGMQNLKQLNLRKCKIGSIPNMASTKLEYVDLSCNDLDVVPDWIIKQRNLKFLSIGANKIEVVPDLSELPLETLKLHKNRIVEMPKVSNAIKSLNLYLNPMSCIPKGVLNLTLLEVFSFGVTKTMDLPSLSSLPNLRWLTLTVNEITHLPDDICSLKKLEGLQLAKNKLVCMPSKIGEMNLSNLTLYSNQISELPESFFKLPLKKLNLARNPLKNKAAVLKVFGNIDFMRI